MRVPQRMKACVLRELQSAEQERDGRGDRIRLQWRSIRVRENQVSLIIRPELISEYILLFAVALEGGDSRLRQRNVSFPTCLRALEF